LGVPRFLPFAFPCSFYIILNFCSTSSASVSVWVGGVGYVDGASVWCLGDAGWGRRVAGTTLTADCLPLSLA